jgi:hypothetical protein
MKAMIVGGDRGVRRLAAEASEARIELTTIAQAAGPEASVSALASRLCELERAITTERPDAVVLADDTDTALAGLLVASKLGVTVVVGAGEGFSGPNGRLIGQLAEERVSATPGGLGDWARSYTGTR